MPRIAATMFSLFHAFVLGAAGIPLALWAAMASYRADWASAWALWALERSPLPLYAAPVRVAGDVMQRDFLVAASLAAAVLCLLAFFALRSAQRALRAADESHDGKATVELKTQALRVGRPVEGSIWLAQRPQRGELYRVQLSCSRGHGPGKSGHAETAYWEELEALPVFTPVGWSLPFRFVVPHIAPPSGVSSFTSGPGYHWRLAVQRAQGWMSFPSVFALHLAPAPAEELGAIERRGPGRMEPELKHAGEAIARSPVREPVLEERPALREELKQANGGIAPNASRDSPLHERPEFREDASRGGTGTPNSFGDVTPGDTRARDTIADIRYPYGAEGASRGGTGAPTFSVGDVTPGDARAPDTITHIGYRYGAEGVPYDQETVREAGLFTKIVKWLFLVLFGGALAISAVALVTAVLLAYVL